MFDVMLGLIPLVLCPRSHTIFTQPADVIGVTSLATAVDGILQQHNDLR